MMSWEHRIYLKSQEPAVPDYLAAWVGRSFKRTTVGEAVRTPQG